MKTGRQGDKETGREIALEPSLFYRVVFFELPKGDLLWRVLALGALAAVLLLSIAASGPWSVPRHGDGCGITEGQVRTLEAALSAYKSLNKNYPSQSQGRASLVTRPAIDTQPQRWSQFVKLEALVDPWDRKMQYRNPGVRNPNGYDVYSLGPDGIESADDIGNW
jgi:general secretion pathway protein G